MEYQRILNNHVVPAIKQMWPDLNQDNAFGASSHKKVDDKEFGIPARQQGFWNINILTQSPKLLDTNICDLTFLCSTVGAVEEPRGLNN